MRNSDLARLRAEYRIMDSIGLIVPNPNKRAYYPRHGYMVSEAIFKAGFRLLIDLVFQFVMKFYSLALT